MFTYKRPPNPIEQNWNAQAVPGELVYAGAISMEGLKKAYTASKRNRSYMKTELQRNGGQVIGFHGTTRDAAKSIAESGFENRRNIEGGWGVSAWASVAAMRAADFADNRAGGSGEGVVIILELHNPTYDKRYGRLEWLGLAGSVRFIAAYPVDEFRAMCEQDGSFAVDTWRLQQASVA